MWEPVNLPSDIGPTALSAAPISVHPKHKKWDEACKMKEKKIRNSKSETSTNVQKAKRLTPGDNRFGHLNLGFWICFPNGTGQQASACGGVVGFRL
jgi:hypothetical protein